MKRHTHVMSHLAFLLLCGSHALTHHLVSGLSQRRSTLCARGLLRFRDELSGLAVSTAKSFRHGEALLRFRLLLHESHRRLLRHVSHGENTRVATSPAPHTHTKHMHKHVHKHMASVATRVRGDSTLRFEPSPKLPASPCGPSIGVPPHVNLERLPRCSATPSHHDTTNVCHIKAPPQGTQQA